MAKVKQTSEKGPWETRSKFKKTGQGNSRRTSKLMMNKSKRRSFKRYRGQGR